MPGPGETMFECAFCHVKNTIQDSRNYVEQAKKELLAWMSKAIPPGIDVTNAQNADPLARANIFTNNFRPSIESSFKEYRFGLIRASSNQLISLPYRQVVINIEHTPKQLYDYDAKTHSVAPFAVDDESKKILSDASMVANAYALVLNNIDLLSGNDVHKYQFMKSNFISAAEVLKDAPEYRLLVKRFEALATAVDGIDGIMMNRHSEAKALLQKASNDLAQLRQEAMSDSTFGSMSIPIVKEIGVCDSAYLIADSLDTEKPLDTVSILKTIKVFMDEIEREEKQIQGAYSTVMKRQDRYKDLFITFSSIIKAKTGEGMLKIAPGSGQYYVPMWVVDVGYSFMGGSLLKKKAVVVSELILASGVFTTSNSAAANPRSAVTDVFGAMPEGNLLQRLKGNQDTISAGGPVRDLSNNLSMGSVGGAKIILPTTTKQEVEVLCNAYMEQCKSTHTKLKMGKATAKELIFVPCDIVAGKIKLNVNLANTHPNDLGNVAILDDLSL
jgi:hypothetical protein